MDNYIVSARKYRPTSFSSVIGQTALTDTLKNAILLGKLASSYLFCGPRGVGKTTCARIFAKAINCQNLGPDGEPCGICESCKSFNEDLRSYNVFELDAASNNAVDDIRTLNEQVRIPPMNGKYKVYVIDEVHMLSSAAFNAFLKTLEEPPRYAIFILATTEKNKIIPTILSRCQIYDFNRISNEDIVRNLKAIAQKENIEVEDQALEIIAEKSDGGMRDALSIFDQVVSFTGGHITYQKTIANLNVIDYEYYFRFTEYFLEKKIPESLLLLNELLQKGFDGSHLISGMMLHVRNLLVSHDQCTLPLLQVSKETKEKYGKQSAKCNPKFLYRLLKILNNCDLSYRESKNKRLLVEITLIQACQAGDDDDDSGGRRPKILKSIFSKKAAQQKDTSIIEANAMSVSNKNVQETQDDKAVTTEKKKTSSKPALPTIDSKSLFISIHGNNSASDARKKDTSAVSSVNEDSTKEKKTLSSELLVYHWQNFAANLPQIDTPLVNRMLNTTPVVESDNKFKIIASNKMVADEFEINKERILTYLCNCFNNKDIEMQINIDTTVKAQKILNKNEQYQKMKESNQLLSELEKRFHLELK